MSTDLTVVRTQIAEAQEVGDQAAANRKSLELQALARRRGDDERKAEVAVQRAKIDALAVLQDMARGVIEVPMQTVGGLRDAGQETLEAMDSLARWLNSNVADLTVVDPENDIEINLPSIPQSQSITGGVYRGIVQFVGGMAGAGKFTGLSKLKKLSKTGNAAKLGIQGALADSIARDPNEENLANFIRQLTGDQKNAVLNFLASDPNDGEGRARLKKAFEGLGVGAVFDGLFLMLSALRAARRLKKAAPKRTRECQ